MSDLEGPAVERSQTREWIAERIGWLVIAFIVIAGTQGLLGPGVLSRTSQVSPFGSSVLRGVFV